MTKWTDIISTVSAIIGILGFIGIIIGVISFYNDLTKRAREKDAGRVCCDADKMGYFAVKEPSLYRPWLYLKTKVARPVVPDMSAFIKAGDDLAFTSALFDGIFANHDEVCWRPIYEGFFNELAWNQKSKYWTSVSEDSKLGEYAKQADRHMKKLSKWSEELSKADNKARREIIKKKGQIPAEQITGATDSAPGQREANPGDNDAESQKPRTQSTWTKWLTRNWHEDSGSDLKRQTQDKPYLDRHVLYREFEDGPHLLNCVRHLDGITPESRLEETSEVWIYNKKPCIETSAYELTALSLMLGMRLQTGRDASTKIGYGASGMSMMSQYTHGFGQLHFAYSGDFEDVIEKPMGSGYSMLFAKHMACGGLPIGLHYEHTMTLVLSDDTVDNIIKMGKPISCGADSEPGDMAVKALYRMPSSRYIFLHFPEESSSDPYDFEPSDEITWTENGNPYSQPWSKAVAGIAFGGLVPQATQSLVDAVKFTALGGCKWDEDNSSFDWVQDLIFAVHQRAVSQKNGSDGNNTDVDELREKSRVRLHLFGSYRARGISNIKHKSDILDPYLGWPGKNLDTRTAARVFSCYMTLLECATAQYFHAQPNSFEKEGPETPVERVFTACSKELKTAYWNAVEMERKSRKEDETKSAHSRTEMSSPGPLLSDSKNSGDQMTETRLEVNTANKELVSTSNDQDSIEVAEHTRDPVAKPEDESSSSLNDPKISRGQEALEPRIIEITRDPGLEMSESTKEDRQPLLILLERPKSPPRPADEPLLSEKIKKLVYEINGYDSEGKKSTDGCQFNAEVCARIARVIIAVWAFQVQIIEWDNKFPNGNGPNGPASNHVSALTNLMPSPDSFPDILAFGGM